MMDLFTISNKHNNLLPYDGIAIYYGKIFDTANADINFNQLLQNINWKHDEVMMYGKKIITKRKTAWYADAPFDYVYSGIGRKALLWTEELIAIKNKVQNTTDETYNSCLLNLYHNGSEAMSWHSDNEKTLAMHAAIASISFGAVRKFSFRHRVSKETISVVLEHGSLLLMKGSTQSHWLHQMPATTKVKAARINLTFRTFVGL